MGRPDPGCRRHLPAGPHGRRRLRGTSVGGHGMYVVGRLNATTEVLTRVRDAALLGLCDYLFGRIGALGMTSSMCPRRFDVYKQ